MRRRKSAIASSGMWTRNGRMASAVEGWAAGCVAAVVTLFSLFFGAAVVTDEHTARASVPAATRNAVVYLRVAMFIVDSSLWARWRPRRADFSHGGASKPMEFDQVRSDLNPVRRSDTIA